MRRGFTLIELLVVITIIGILLTIALPNFLRARDKAYETQVRAGLADIRNAIERFAADHNGFYPGYLWGGTPAAWCVDPADPDGLVEACLGSADEGFARYGGRYRVLDPLIRYNYLTAYPRNPFVKHVPSLCNATRNDPRFNCVPLPDGTVEEDMATMGNILPDPNFPDSTFGGITDLGPANRMPALYFVGDNNPETIDFIPGMFFYRSYRNGRQLRWCEGPGLDFSLGQRPPNPVNCETDALGEVYVLGAYGSARTAGTDFLCDPILGTCAVPVCPSGTRQWQDYYYGHPMFPWGLPNAVFRDAMDPDLDGNINADDCDNDGVGGGMDDCDADEGPSCTLGKTFRWKTQNPRAEPGTPDSRLDGIIVVMTDFLQ